MRAVDTNVLVRVIVRDDTRQAIAADKFIAKGAWISHLVLAETVWVLNSVYGFDAQRIAMAVDMLLNHAELALQDPEIVEAALLGYRQRPAVSFSDNLILEIARKSGHLPLGTLDRRLGAIEGAERLRSS